MSLDKIDKIRKIGESISDLNVGGTEKFDNAMMKERFETLMREDAHRPQEITQISKDPNKIGTPMDEARKIGGQITQTSNKVTPSEIVGQTRSASRRIEAIKQRLGGADVEIRPSVQGLLRKKLHHIDKNINTALAKSGASEEDLKVSSTDGEMVDGILNPVHRFLGMLTKGQNELDTLSTTITNFGNSDDVSPAALLAIQIKVTRVQQEIELFTSLLNKALESTKTIMNVQV